MAKKAMSGKFITFEGTEGCGKSTQSKLLYQYLRRLGYPVIYLREPGGTKISERVRKILLDSKNDSISPLCETLLYMACRAQVVSEVIRPALAKGDIVICDRFLDSTIAYQGFGLGVDLKFIKYIGDFITAGARPNLTIFLDLPIEEGLKYRQGKKDRIEGRSLVYHIRVRDGYFNLARLDPGRIKIIKVNKKKSITQEGIRKIALDVVSRYKRAR